MKKLYYNGNIITMVKEGECVDALNRRGQDKRNRKL